MSVYDLVKVYDLSNAPPDLREADELAALRPGDPNSDTAILVLQVGEFETIQPGPINDCITREITLTEYKLHQWLTEHGAVKGESVLLRWKQ